MLIVGDDSVRVQAEEISAAPSSARSAAALAEYARDRRPEVSVTNVGPTWGDKVSDKALTALVVFFVVIALYLTFRFEWRMALAAIVAVVHDIIITVGVYAITGFEVTPATVVAFLTILGFSLYDTVVVFDKVKENEATLGTVRGDTYSVMVNRSLNQVLMRSLNTSVVAVLPVASLLFVGTFVLGGLTLAGLRARAVRRPDRGAYSSIFVATPILAWLKEREPKYRVAARAGGRRSRRMAKVVARPRAVVAGVPVAAPVAGDADRPGHRRRRDRRRANRSSSSSRHRHTDRAARRRAAPPAAAGRGEHRGRASSAAASADEGLDAGPGNARGAGRAGLAR